MIRLADRQNGQWLYWLQGGRHVEELEGALLNGGGLWIEHEGRGAVAHGHGVAGEGGEIGEQGLEAVHREIVVGALGIDLSLGGIGANRLGDNRAACRLGRGLAYASYPPLAGPRVGPASGNIVCTACP